MKQHHGRHDWYQGSAGGDEWRLRDDPGRPDDRRSDTCANGHQCCGIGRRQEDVAGEQGRCSRAADTEERLQPSALDYSAGLERRTPRVQRGAQRATDVPAQIDHGDLRVSLVRENLSDRVLRYFRVLRSKIEDVHVSSYSLVSRPEFSGKFSTCKRVLFIAAISSSRVY